MREFLDRRIDAEIRFRIAARGPLDPVASNATAEGRAANRRTEIVLRGDW